MTRIVELLHGHTLILLSNREPYEHGRDSRGEVAVARPAGGLVSALDPTMRETRGVWVAWGSGNADGETADDAGRLQVPPDDPAYTLRRVWLDEDDVAGFYLGFANSVLWPLCHMLIQHLAFRSEHWERYRAVNERFADAVADEARRARDGAADARPIVWVHDYHFALAPAMIRERVPETFVHQFWHIPFPPPDIFRILPGGVYVAIMRGMLGNDLLAFHTERYAANFLSCVEDALPDARVDRERSEVTFGGRTTAVDVFPISIDASAYEAMARTHAAVEQARRFRERYATGDRQLGVSVDRVDYTKGIPERLQALDLLWCESPELRERFTMLVVATPSRSDIEAYKNLETEVERTVREINERHGTESWTPIVLVAENVDAELLVSVYRAADLCLVSSLQDGMNLVAKEFIASQVDENGVLVLSRFAGAAEDMEGAMLINPFNVDGFAEGLRKALALPLEERRARMHRMRAQLAGATIFDWLEGILERANELLARAGGTHA